jgi:hypothetical protein
VPATHAGGAGGAGRYQAEPGNEVGEAGWTGFQ